LVEFHPGMFRSERVPYRGNLTAVNPAGGTASIIVRRAGAAFSRALAQRKESTFDPLGTIGTRQAA